MNDETVNGILNRHMARLLGDLEDAQCPRVYHGIVKGALVWLRDDVCKHGEQNNGNAHTETNRQV
jgi:hypothetical protein